MLNSLVKNKIETKIYHESLIPFKGRDLIGLKFIIKLHDIKINLTC